MTIFQYMARRNEIENRYDTLIAQEDTFTARAYLRAEKRNALATLDREFGH